MHAFVIACKHFARTAKASLNFIGDEENVVLFANIITGLQVSIVRNDHSCLALHRLKHDGGGLGPDSPVPDGWPCPVASTTVDAGTPPPPQN